MKYQIPEEICFFLPPQRLNFHFAGNCRWGSAEDAELGHGAPMPGEPPSPEGNIWELWHSLKQKQSSRKGCDPLQVTPAGKLMEMGVLYLL